ncbi:MAG: hypothetical protein HQK54_09620 [Oligoflexales bacterium]|nr:hypothetical protein [Oligoflexales bacterium]
MNSFICRILAAIAIYVSLVREYSAFARKGSEPVYQDSFDIAAGGASLTRASRDGRLFSNPALLPYGGRFHRWGGINASLLANDELKNFAGGSSAESSDSGSADNNSMDAYFGTPVYVEENFSLSYVSKAFGISIFSDLSFDYMARKIGSNGAPDIKFQLDTYNGMMLAGASKTTRWFSVGAGVKPVVGKEKDLFLGLDDIDQITGDDGKIDNGKASNYVNTKIKGDTSLRSGVGFDIGLLGFFQGKGNDFSIAVKVDDIGGTVFKQTAVKGAGGSSSEASDSGDGSAHELELFRQVLSSGMGYALHSDGDAVHFAVDYRDILDEYKEPEFKKIHAGMKIVLRSYVGLACGVYQGSPSYGAELDFIFFRIAATKFTKELGDRPGVDPRHLYMASFSMGY